MVYQARVRAWVHAHIRIRGKHKHRGCCQSRGAEDVRVEADDGVSVLEDESRGARGERVGVRSRHHQN